MDPSRASYDEGGNLICQTCSAARSSSQASATMEAGDPSSARNLYGAAGASALLGVVTCCLSALGPFFFVATPLAMLIGGGTLVNLFRRPEMRAQLGGGYWLVIAGGAAGLLFGGLGTLIGILGMAGMGMRG